MSTKNLKLTLGSDPEFFFMRDGKPFPACGLIGGTKERPRSTPFGGVLEDNVMGEVTTIPTRAYARGAEDAWVRHQSMPVEFLNSIATQTGMALDRIRSSYEFSGDILNYFGEKARQFGCDPDFNAYTGRKNPTPDSRSNLRTCAGHIHLGYPDAGDMQERCKFIYYLDHVVGRWCVENDPDLTRMQRYGQAGAFRPKPYGVEYRVPSNFWLQSEDNMRMIFRLCKEAYEQYILGIDIPDPEYLQNEINSMGGVV